MRRAVVKYPGSKWSIADKICAILHPHRSYLEPFFGSGAVFFTKARSPIETINDLDGDVVNLFRWMRDDPERLSREIYWTPYARDTYREACGAGHSDTLDGAVQFCVRLMQGFGCRTNGNHPGFKVDVKGREAAYAAKNWADLPSVIMDAAERLRGVQIEHMDATALIHKYKGDNVLIYADPPYVMQTRTGPQYRCEMGDAEHEKLLEALLEHSGPAIISGYDCPMYNNLLNGWNKNTFRCRDQAGNQKNEVIWFNFDVDMQQQLII